MCAVTASAEVMLQWFETEWDEMYRRLPEVAEVGYDYIWIPSPCKAPTGLGTKWGNVGYNLYDRFDIGDIPQRGSLATRYGTRGSLRNMVDNAHQCDVKIIPDVVMNHNGNGPDFRYYPGMKPEDFHVQWEENHANTLNYKRGPRMWEWHHGDGYGGTLWQELVSLIDVRTEDPYPESGRFTGGNNTPGWNLVGSRPDYIRHVGQYDKYPYFPAGYTNELASEMLYRWITWLGDAMDYDGLRLDAGKHVPHEFFGTYDDQRFLHEAQWSFGQRRGFDNGGYPGEVFQNYIVRDDALIFAEILSYWDELKYWYGYTGNDRNPMRFIDYPLKQKLYDAFSNGNLASLTAGGDGLDPTIGIMYAWGHDEAGPGKINLAYAHILTHIGFPMVYFTGNNITWDDNGTRTWMRPGYDSQALGDLYSDIPNLVWIHQQFARGREYDRWTDNDLFAFERYDDTIAVNGAPDSGEGLLIVAINDSGEPKTASGMGCSFPPDTVLHDYTGHNPTDITVSGGGTIDVTIPPNGDQGWVCYAPYVAEGVGDGTIVVTDNGSPAGTMTWVVPGGLHAIDKTQQVTRVTTTNLTVDVFFKPPSGGGTVDNVAFKWGDGRTRVSPNTWYTGRNDIVLGNYQDCTPQDATNWYVDISITDDNVPEGLNVIKMRPLTAGAPVDRFNTFTKIIYIDRRGPAVDVVQPSEGEVVRGDCVMVISNVDYTALGMTVTVDTNAPETAHEIMKGLWKYNLSGLAGGTHTALVTTTEGDWAESRQAINTSFYSRVFNVVSNVNPISLNHVEGVTKETTFFKTRVTAEGSPDTVRLYWDGYELPFNASGYTNTFNGEVIYRDFLSNVVTDRLWGAFCNGQHFFEAERVDGTVTSRVTRRVVFNLYGINAIDSDGDSLPDNVEMPFIDSDGAPGADAPWPGDDNKDFVPNYGENWTRLNPYNHATFYTEWWDDSMDFDGDTYDNGTEVLAGYAQGNIYMYSIYDSDSAPTATPVIASQALWTPEYPERGDALSVVYLPKEGPLQGSTQVTMHVGHSLKTFGEWKDVTNMAMTSVTGTWQVIYTVSPTATSVEMVFYNSDGVWDNNNGNNWQASVQADTNRYFTMDGSNVDSDAYLVFGTNMHIWAAVKSNNLYAATWAAGGGGNDHFVYVTDEPGNAMDSPWAKAGQVFFDVDNKPYLAGEGATGFEGWFNISGSVGNYYPGVLEGEINLIDAFGYVPGAVYVAAVACGTADGGGINSQGPYPWDDDDNLNVTEFLRVPIASIRDDDLDGYFDVGKPEMWTVMGSDTNDANYGLRRIFLNELAHETETITVILQPNANPGETVTDVELFSNVNRRDFVKMEEDPDTVTTASGDTYYRAYTMNDIGGGRYSYDLEVYKCGAYRINARYKISGANGGNYIYYTDNGLRRDCAVVVSPTKALELTMYELNPMIAEATNDTFVGRSTFEDMFLQNVDRPDTINSNYFPSLGLNIVWLQPIHPIGYDGRENDPDKGGPYDPGSPYAVRNYWTVNDLLGDPKDYDRAMQEFTNFVQALDDKGVGVMLDGTFNHSSWDCEIGEMGVTMGITNNPSLLIRDLRPEWYSREGEYGEHATHYGDSASDLATAPDRVDFGKWEDAADFYFGSYDTLVQGPVADTNNAWASRWYHRYLFEEDRFDGHDQYTREIWEYFSEYPLYWLEKTGHPAGTPKAESYKGIDGLRCDFAQGLPSHFWEYCINKTRSVKWDFIFMAESLDGFREIGGSSRHGVGYRSARHFDVLNENMVFYWRNSFFNYYDLANGKPETFETWEAFDNRRNAFDRSPLLLNLAGHDELLPHDNQWRLLYAYAELAALFGVPMVMYGQEAGAQNDFAYYGGASHPEILNADNNFERYEENFGKSIPLFKAYNAMPKIWDNIGIWAGELRAAYQRVGKARRDSPALQSVNDHFLEVTNAGGGYHPDIFAVAKYETAGVSAATQEVVFVFVNNDYQDSTNRSAWFDLDVTVDGGQNRFGIIAGNNYNIVDLMSTNPTAYIWGGDKPGSTLLSEGINVWLHENTYEGKQAQFLRLVDMAVGVTQPDHDGDGLSDFSDWDDDNDGLPDTFENENNLDSTNASGVFGASGDKDGDTSSNADELVAGTGADASGDFLSITNIEPDGADRDLFWPGVIDRDYKVEHTDDLIDPDAWQETMPYRTALDTDQWYRDDPPSTVSNREYRVKVRR